jgi:hypothetical protein
MSRIAKYFPGLFKSQGYDLKGRKDWLRAVAAEDRAAFVDLGLQFADHGRSGGIARAQTGLRDPRGRFVPNRKE